MEKGAVFDWQESMHVLSCLKTKLFIISDEMNLKRKEHIGFASRGQTQAILSVYPWHTVR